MKVGDIKQFLSHYKDADNIKVFVLVDDIEIELECMTFMTYPLRNVKIPRLLLVPKREHLEE